MPKQRIKTIVTSLEAEIQHGLAAKALADDGGYCDFFVENGGDGKPFHEKCPDDLSATRLTKEKFSASRMGDLARLGLKPRAEDDYCDFFVENGGDGKPWHEKCPEVNAKDLLTNPAVRAFALRRLGVIQAFTRAVEKSAARH